MSNTEQVKQEEQNKEEQANTTQEAPMTEQEEATPEKGITQSEVDALINSIVSKERARAEKTIESMPDKEEHAKLIAEVESLQNALMLSAAKNIASSIGIKSEATDDAVYLAMRAVEADGEERTEENITKAINNILKKYPDWGNKQGGIHKFGIDEENREEDGKQQQRVVVL